MYILSKTITYKYNKIISDIKLKYIVKNPVNPSGNNVKGTISSKTYYNYASYIVKYIEKYNQSPNYIKSGSVKIQYQTTMYSLNKVLNYTNSYGNLPSTLSINVKATHALINYLPVYNKDSNGSSGSSLGSSSGQTTG